MARRAKAKSGSVALVPAQRIERSILLVRGQKVMLDEDLAALYEVQMKVLNRAVKRHIERFPEDFMFQLTDEEFANLRSQVVTSNRNRGGRRYPPHAFIEHGVTSFKAV